MVLAIGGVWAIGELMTSGVAGSPNRLRLWKVRRLAGTERRRLTKQLVNEPLQALPPQ